MGIRESRNRAEQEGFHYKLLNHPDFDEAQRHYMFAIRDPQGKPWNQAYYSFRKGQEAREEMALIIAKKFGVSVEHLKKADSELRARFLCGAGDSYLGIKAIVYND